jgi:tetratricopeptide (TPR) repeat protein
MNLTFLYLFPIFLGLGFLFIFFSGQIIVNQTIDQRLTFLQNWVDSPNASYQDFFLLGQIFLQKENYDAALKNFIVSLAKWNVDDKLGIACCLNTLGVTYFNIGNYYYARYYYLEALKLFPNYLKALNNLAFLYETSNDKPRACMVYKKIWIMDKTNKLARNKFQSLQANYSQDSVSELEI